MARMNRAFHDAVGLPEPCVKFVPGGSLYDIILDLPNQFDRHSLLVIDDPDPSGFYGLDIHHRGVLRAVEKILRESVPLRRVIVRPHPFMGNLDLEPWKQLVRDFPDSCEISSSAWTLEDDLKRVSVVIGSTSGALTVASACGLPTIYVGTDSFATGDLECFLQGQSFLPDDASRAINQVLNDPDAYAVARGLSLKNAREYYEKGSNLEMDGAFVDRLLNESSANTGA